MELGRIGFVTRLSGPVRVEAIAHRGSGGKLVIRSFDFLTTARASPVVQNVPSKVPVFHGFKHKELLPSIRPTICGGLGGLQLQPYETGRGYAGMCKYSSIQSIFSGSKIDSNTQMSRCRRLLGDMLACGQRTLN
jgi:hypothetical protein